MTTGQKKFSFFSKLTASHSNPAKEFNKHAKNLYGIEEDKKCVNI